MRDATACMTAAFCLWLPLAAGCSLPLTARPASPDVVDRALAYFAGLLRRSPSADLAWIRTRALNPEGVRATVATLPVQGNLEPNRAEAAKLEALTPVLVHHERHGVIVLQVIDVPQAVIGLYGRAVLLISPAALRMLSEDELQAVVAHELAHDFFWYEYDDALRRRDRRTLHEIELKCDGVATLTLLALRRDPAALTTAITKLTRFNDALGANANADRYPGLRDRSRFLRALLSLESQPGR